RLVHLTFHGETRADHHTYDHAHESPNVMLIPLVVLAIGAVLSGVVFYDHFFGHAEHIEHFFAGSLVVDADILDAAHHVPLWVKWSATIAMVLGFLAAWQMYIRNREMPHRLATQHRGL